MKRYHIYFILLKILVVIQFVLVTLKKQSRDSKMYILSDTIFKISVALYLLLFFTLNSFPGLEWQDVVIIKFSGMILLYDIDFNGLIKIVREYVPMLPKIPILEYDYVLAPLSIA
jgi:heme/copper-type cytochrome/quinol oxidase subunit 4